MLVDYYLGQLTFRLTDGIRRENIIRAQQSYERFLIRLEDYGMLDKQSVDAYERYQENREGFTTILTSDAARRRDVKIANFKAEKALKQKIEVGHKTKLETSVAEL